jgi:hypothetical protein
MSHETIPLNGYFNLHKLPSQVKQNRNNPNVLAGSESEQKVRIRIRIRIRIQTLL